MTSRAHDRRGFLHGILAAGGRAAAAPAAAQAQAQARGATRSFLPRVHTRAELQIAEAVELRHRPAATAIAGRSPPGGVAGGLQRDRARASSRHIWFTIAAQSGDHLKELVLRGYWDGNAKPSVEAPIGDFFGLNLDSYFIYQSEYLACSPGRSLNCYFVMPYKRSARFTVTNEGKQQVGVVLFEHRLHDRPGAARRRAVLPRAIPSERALRAGAGAERQKLNPDGKLNYVYMETRGRGHLMGVHARRAAERQRLVGRRRRHDLHRR